jgi:hypothetical protein
MSNNQQTPPTLAQDLAFTSFPFNSQLVDDVQEPKENGGGFRGFFNKFFSDGTQAASPTPPVTTLAIDITEPSTSDEPGK